MNKITYGYNSPRWSNEYLDCSMPMTFDTYSFCSFNCLYCFSFNQKILRLKGYKKEVAAVNPKKVKEIFLLKKPSQFSSFIKQHKFLQWGGLSDPFDNFEKVYGISLDLLQFFKQINYPICFSTKGTFWAYDERYRKCFYNQPNWYTKFSIINLDETRAKMIEVSVPSPQERLQALKEISKINPNGTILRLRPFIIGLSDKNDEYLDLIKLAKDCGATAVSTEFFCLEIRSVKARKNYDRISEVVGYNIYEFYKKFSYKQAGYLRLNRDLKAKYWDKMEDLCKKLNMRFYVSDNHGKDYCHNGSCCGLPSNENYEKGQFTTALCLAKEKKTIKFSDVAKDIDPSFKEILFKDATGLNTESTAHRTRYKNFTLYSKLHQFWNNPRYFTHYYGSILRPIGVDENGDVIYEYIGDK